MILIFFFYCLFRKSYKNIPTSDKMDISPTKQKEKFIETLLPFTFHKEAVRLPENLAIKLDLAVQQEKVLLKLATYELTLKYEIISSQLKIEFIINRFFQIYYLK